MLKRWLIYLASVLFGLALVGALLAAFVFALLYPTLPSLEALTDYQPKIPLRILSSEGELLGEFGVVADDWYDGPQSARTPSANASPLRRRRRPRPRG